MESEVFRMKKVRILLSGAAGYGEYYLQLLAKHVDRARFDLCGIVDPFVTAETVGLSWVREEKVPFYRTMEEFYAENAADLVILSCPIQFHKEQALCAMAHGSHVLCEKPLTADMADVKALEEAAARYGKMLAVGFQWSFCSPILSLKRDILAGRFGRPLALKTLISWQRFDSYYEQSSWKGRIYDMAGRLVLDSVATNATAHYLHNLFFVMGESLPEAAMPQSVRYGAYRAKEIESFDTCFAAGKFANGADFLYIATHSGDRNIEPVFRYEFENAAVETRGEGYNPHVVARFQDGTEIDYGQPQSDASCAQKITAMLDYIDGRGEVACLPSTVKPHLAVCTGFFLAAPIRDFPPEWTFRTQDPPGTFVRGLADDCLLCYEKGLLPYEAGLGWAQPETEFDPAKYL